MAARRECRRSSPRVISAPGASTSVATNRLVERLLLAHGLPQPTVEHVVRAPDGTHLGRLDLAFEPFLIGLEMDGRRHHLTAAAFERDRYRQNQLELHGWLILRYTWLHYTRTPQQIVNDVAAAIRHRSLRANPDLALSVPH